MKILLIIDMQKGFINNNNKFLIEKIENLLKNSDKFDKIIATKFINHASSQYVEHLDWAKMKRSGLSEFAIDLPKNANVIEKET